MKPETISLSEAPPPLISLAPDPSLDPAANQLQTADQSARAAALQAVPFTWLGKQLAPFTPSREAAFHQHRSSLNAPEFHDVIDDSHSFSADSARILWFLSHEPSEWLNFLSHQPRGRMDKDGGWQSLNAHAALEERIQKWMDETWAGSTEERSRAYTLCIDIITRARATRARHQDPGDPDTSGN